MTVAELRKLLEPYPDYYDVLVVAYDGAIVNVDRIEEWRHFQTGESMGAVLIEPMESE